MTDLYIKPKIHTIYLNLLKENGVPNACILKPPRTADRKGFYYPQKKLSHMLRKLPIGAFHINLSYTLSVLETKMYSQPHYGVPFVVTS